MQLLGISGSLRKDSFNTRLLGVAEEIIAAEGARLVHCDISALPLYNGDLDSETKPPAVENLLAQIANADGLFIATPEYNYSIPGVLKNALDWASRPGFKSVLANIPCAIVSASPSLVGGARAQAHLRTVLSSTLAQVYSAPDFLLAQANTAFDTAGRLKDAKSHERLVRLISGYLAWIKQQEAAQ